ncbi:SDR family oxidoreductase [Rhodohalobacter sp.]|uniref:SDR family NAD(P)-dependent oxidoreductase n=1 Tax=Rhodohalobacter sp. TaxID=1974210 RepID=UPI002ACD54E1|nr:SDR family oxidoreductase [Rhodohalobacter sp.]MDZ7755553.1 SDR family oxidoreductase [Rhodohalobacter sp.]
MNFYSWRQIMEFSNKKILITGGSAGIGKALVREFSEREVTDIAVMGRSGEKLDELEKDFPSVHFLKIQGDVSQPEDIKDAVNTVKEQWNTLDILINNAGVVSAGPLEEISDEDVISQVNINLTGLILMTKYFLPLLKQSKNGAIMNISSGLGYIAMPFYSVYAATKAAVKHFSESIRRELIHYPIHVMTVYPTATDTSMMQSAGVDPDNMDTPEEVAKASLEGLIDKRIEVILGGEKRKEDIQLNFNAPLKMDKKVENAFKSLQKRTATHRSM